jgi:hypothetical protein
VDGKEKVLNDGPDEHNSKKSKTPLFTTPMQPNVRICKWKSKPSLSSCKCRIIKLTNGWKGS